MSNLKIYLTNLGKYNEGYLIGKFVQLPIKKEDLKEVLKEIGIDGIQYEEYFISDVETDIIGMGEIIEEYTSIKDLNELAEMLDNLNNADLEKLQAILEAEKISSISELKQTIETLDNWNLYTDVNNEKDLGHLYADEFLCIEIPNYIKNYFDYESYGHDLRLELNGTFTTFGYILED